MAYVGGALAAFKKPAMGIRAMIHDDDVVPNFDHVT